MGFNLVNCQEVLGRPSTVPVRILVRYRVSLHTALVPQLQHGTTKSYCVQSASNLYSQAPCSRRPAALITLHYVLASVNAAHISVHEHYIDYNGYRGLKPCRSSCVPSSREPCTALCTISTLNKMPHHYGEKPCREVCDPI
jgi:hypothetical protein